MREDIKQIRKILKDYAKLHQDLQEINLLPSPSFEAASSHSNLNHMENTLVYHANIVNRMHRVELAIKNISNSKYRFIINKYIIDKKYNREQLCKRYNISVRGFNYMKNRALVEFAKNYGLDSLLDEMQKPLVYEWSSYVVSIQMNLGEKSVCGRNQNNKTVVQRLPSMENKSSP